jgi:hypothetical protein
MSADLMTSSTREETSGSEREAKTSSGMLGLMETTVMTAKPEPVNSSNQVPSDLEVLFSQQNAYRRLHQVAPFVWDKNLAAGAQVWADSCQNRFDSSIYSDGIGESLNWASFGDRSWVQIQNDIVDNWYTGSKHYNYRLGTVIEPEWMGAIPYFAQMLWKSSLKIGCGFKSCLDGTDLAGGFGFVCRYFPRGNIDGQYVENVFSPMYSTPSPGDEPHFDVLKLALSFQVFEFSFAVIVLFIQAFDIPFESVFVTVISSFEGLVLYFQLIILHAVNQYCDLIL